MDNDFCFIYFHGFKSSPESTKALFIRRYAEENNIEFYCPPLDISPEVAINQVNATVTNVIGTKKKPVLIGSSLGGFYSTWIMQNHENADNCLAILLNPCSTPSNDLKSEVVDLKNWQEKILKEDYFKPEHLNYLVKLETEIAQKIKFPKKILLVAAKGDEVLDWKEMVAFFDDCEHYVIEGSDHSLTNFSAHWAFIIKFISIT